jgi:hypothetical protein
MTMLRSGASEAVGVRLLDHRMLHARTGDLQVVVLHHGAGSCELVRVHERHERLASFVGDANVHVGRAHLEEEPRDPLDRRWSVRIDAMTHAARPREQQQVAVVGIVIGVMMRDEDIAQCAERKTGEHELPRHAVGAVDHVEISAGDDHLRGGHAADARPRSAAGAEQDEARRCAT